MSASDQDNAGDLLIQEVEEDLRREQYLKLWKQYGNIIMAAVLCVIVVVAGYQGWQSWQSKLRLKESDQLAAAQALATDGKKTEAIDALAKLAADSHTGYGIAADLLRADLIAQKDDIPGAIAAYEKIATSSAPQPFRDLALLKGIILAVDTADPATLEEKVNPLTTASSPWRYSAMEVQAMLAQKKGDLKRATDLYKQLSDNAEAPQGVRSRAAEMLAALNWTNPALPTESQPKPTPDKVKG